MIQAKWSLFSKNEKKSVPHVFKNFARVSLVFVTSTHLLIANPPSQDLLKDMRVERFEPNQDTHIAQETDPSIQPTPRRPESFLPLFPLSPETFTPETDTSTQEQAPQTPPPPPSPEPTPTPSTTHTIETPPEPNSLPKESIPPIPQTPTLPETPTNADTSPQPQILPFIDKPNEQAQELNTPQQPLRYLINFSNVAITEYIRFISRISGKNFIFSENDLNFNVTVISEEPVTVSDILTMLLQELRIYNLMLIEEGDNFIIHRNTDVNSPSQVIGPNSPEPSAHLITKVFRFTSFDATKAETIVRPLLSNQSIIQALPESGMLIITDLRANLEKIEELLAQLDAPMTGLSIGQYRSSKIFAEALAVLGQRILLPLAEGKEIRFIPLSDTNTLFIISTPIMVSRAVEFFTSLDQQISQQASLSSSTHLIGGELFNKTNPSLNPTNPDNNPPSENTDTPTQTPPPTTPTQESNNPLTNFGAGPVPNLPFSPLDSSEGFLRDMLPQGHMSNTEFEIYKLEHRKGNQIQEALQQIGSSMIETKKDLGSENTEKNHELLSAINSTQWIESSNALVFTGTPKANQKLKNLILELDVPNQQVLIELLLLDTNLSNTYKFGVNWGTQFGGPNAAGAQAFLSDGSPLQTALGLGNNSSINSGQNLSASQLAGAGFNLGVIGRTLSFNGLEFSNLGAMVSAAHNNSDSEVVLNQKLVVEENTQAEIFVGLNIPFRSDSIVNELGNTVTSNVEYRDVGAKMTVTPIINTNGIITLEIQQELSTVSSEVAGQLLSSSTFSQSDVPLITTRKSNSSSTVFVPNGFFCIMSGAIQDEEVRARSQVPCLGGIPVLGGLFSDKNNSGTKRSLLMFIRPTLLNTKEDILRETKRQQDIFDHKSQNYDMWRYEIDEAMDFLNIHDPKPCG